MGSKKILVVDDENDILQILYKKLSAQGYQVFKAANGEEAIENAKSCIPDLILMDILLPDIDGAQVVMTLKEIASTQNIPVIFLSGIAGGEGDDGGIKVGGRRFPVLAKPFIFEDLLRAVQKVLK